MMRVMRHPFSRCALLCCHAITFNAAIAMAQDAVKPHEVIIEPPTLHSLGFEWPISGDANRNASVAVRFRKTSDDKWREGLPLFRIGGETAAGEAGWAEVGIPHMFNGSIFDLEPGTEYQIEFAMTDADGGSGEKRVVVARTKPEPAMYNGGSQLHVYPPNRSGEKQTPDFANLNAAFDAAKPGDQILVHAGTYVGHYEWKKSGEPGKPIVIRGAGDGDAILVNDKAKQMFDIHTCNDLWFEDLSFRDPGTGDGGNTLDGVVLLAGNFSSGVTPGCKRLVVRNCTFEDIGVGIMAADAACEGFVITDNRFLGRQDWTGTPNPPEQRDPNAPYPWSYVGVWVSGAGHDVAYNFVRGFHDGIDVTYGHDDEKRGWKKGSVSIDFYNNDITEMADDFMETDNGFYNIRVMRNRCTNSRACGISAQPVMGGPVYFVRNTLYNVSREYGRDRQVGFKLEVNPAGVLVYHNTCIAAINDNRYASNVHFRNNLIMTSLHEGAVVLRNQTHTSYSSLDYDGWTPGLFRWGSPGGGGQFNSLEEFSRGTGQERHGVVVNYDIFASPPEQYFGLDKEYQPEEPNFTLKPGSVAEDAGCRLPNLNDDFTGKAPDLGALEIGRPVPHYGPRPKSPAQHQHATGG